MTIWQNNCALRSYTEKQFLSKGCRNFSRWQIAASTRILSCVSTSPQMQQDCRPLNVKRINKASALSSRAILEGLEGGRGCRGPEDLCTTSWHHTRDFFPFLNLSSPTPTSRDSCDTTWGNLSHFTGVTKGLSAHPEASLPTSPKQLPESSRLLLSSHPRHRVTKIGVYFWIKKLIFFSIKHNRTPTDFFLNSILTLWLLEVVPQWFTWCFMKCASHKKALLLV